MNASLDEFRGYVLGFANDNRTPELLMVPMNGGFQLRFLDYTLEAARGHARLFRTADALVKFVDRHVCQHARTRVRVTVELSGSSLF